MENYKNKALVRAIQGRKKKEKGKKKNSQKNKNSKSRELITTIFNTYGE